MDQSKKTMRHFYCRDVLWETFEQMANDFDCSIDYLVNEAMRYYARSKNYQSPGGPPGATGPQPTGGPGPGPTPGPNASGANSYPKPGMPARSGAATNSPAMSAGGNGMGAPASARRPAPPTPGYAAPRSGGPSAAQPPWLPSPRRW